MKKDIFLTFDMDWASDDVLDEFITMMRNYDVSGTIHVTHYTPMIEVMREEPERFELGIHPNYNQILTATEQSVCGGVENIISKLKEIVPEAVCCRSHSLTDSSIIASRYEQYGIKYDLNKYIPPKHGMTIFPWPSHLCSDVMVLPFIFEDDVYLTSNTMKIKDYFKGTFEAPFIFNFHPIHVYLNTDNIERYESARSVFQKPALLKNYRNIKQYGVRNMLEEVINLGRQQGLSFKKISEGDWR